MQISKFCCEAFGRLLFVFYIFQGLAVNPPSLLHSSMLLHHLKSCLSYHPVLCANVSSTVPQWLLSCKLSLSFLLLSTPHPVPSLLINTEESDVLWTLKSKAFLSSRHHPLPFSHGPYTLAHVRGHYYSVQTQSSLSQLRKHHTVTMWKKNEVSVMFH